MRWPRTLYIVLIAAVGIFLYAMFVWSRTPPDTITLSEVAALAEAGSIERISVQEDKLTLHLKGEELKTAHKEPDTSVIETLRRLGVNQEQRNAIDIDVAPPSRWGGWLALLGTVLPLVLIGLFFVFILRQAQGAGNQALSFGKSRARMFTGDKPSVTFDDVAGADEAKQE
ncbi:MAG: ATP-dependent metallopeptidase FtsH/Yme1/Tma family protein, partial [Anaerolineae bacterium]